MTKKCNVILLLVILVFLVQGCKEKPVISNNIEITSNEFTETTTRFEPRTNNVELAAVGDLMVHQWQMDDAYVSSSAMYDFDYCFEPVYDEIKSADLAIANFETVTAGKDIGYSDYPCFNTPDEFVEAVKNAGFDVVTTANNHSMDKGVEGLKRTIDILDKNGIDHFGTYKTQQSSNNILIKEVNNIKFAFISWTYGTNGINVPEEYLVNIISQQKIESDIQKAKLLNPDFIIVMPHIGNEYESQPKQVFKDWIDIMIKAGADVVLASHPHVLQPMEYRTVVCDDGSQRNAFVAYSLANFISSQRTEPRDAGVILKIEFEKTDGQEAFIKNVRYSPTWVQWKDTSGGYNIRVLTVYDALNDSDKFKLRSQDIKRLKNVHYQSNLIISGKEVGEVEREYILYNKP